MLQRFGRAYAAARQAVEESAAKSPPLKAPTPRPSPRTPPRVQRGLALLALDGPADAALPRIEHAALAAGARGVLITGDARVEAFRRPGPVATEHLPDPADIVLLTGEGIELARAYLLRRLRIMLDRWVVTECLWSGDAAAELVALRAGHPDHGQDDIVFRPLD